MSQRWLVVVMMAVVVSGLCVGLGDAKRMIGEDLDEYEQVERADWNQGRRRHRGPGNRGRPLLNQAVGDIRGPPVRPGKSRIIKGREAGEGNANFMMNVWAVLEEGWPVQYVCSGVIVNNRTILTAAHCILGKTGHRYRAGDYSMAKKEYGELELFAEKVAIHDQYDIAVIKTTKYIPYVIGNNVNKIGIWPTQMATIDYRAITPQPGYILGWGSITNGDMYLGPLLRADVMTKHCVWDSHPANICTDQRTCSGDSGGPLMIKNPYTGEYEVAGILGGSMRTDDQKCGEGSHSFFTNVWYVRDWIMKQ